MLGELRRVAAGWAGPGAVSSGAVWHGRLAQASSGPAWQRKLWRGRRGLLGRGPAGQVRGKARRAAARNGGAGVVCQGCARCAGLGRQGWAWTVVAWSVASCSVEAGLRLGGRCLVGRGESGTRRGRRGKARSASYGQVWLGRHGGARNGRAMLGMAGVQWLGASRSGESELGMAG